MAPFLSKQLLVSNVASVSTGLGAVSRAYKQDGDERKIDTKKVEQEPIAVLDSCHFGGQRTLSYNLERNLRADIYLPYIYLG